MKGQSLLLILAAFAGIAGCSRKPAQVESFSDPAVDAQQSNQPMKSPGELTRDLNWLVANSPFIFIGGVSSQSSEKDARGMIVTRNEFAVEQVIAGDASKKSIRLTTLGGSTGDVAMKVSHMPEFMRNRRYLIFTDLARTVYNPITGNEGGVFIVADGGVYSHDGQSITAVENGLIQFGDVSIDRADPEKTVARAEDPKVNGAIISVQRAEPDQRRTLSIDDFSTAIRSAKSR